MKCGFCGADNPDGMKKCMYCHADLTTQRADYAEAPSWRTGYPNLPTIAGGKDRAKETRKADKSTWIVYAKKSQLIVVSMVLLLVCFVLQRVLFHFIDETVMLVAYIVITAVLMAVEFRLSAVSVVFSIAAPYSTASAVAVLVDPDQKLRVSAATTISGFLYLMAILVIAFGMVKMCELFPRLRKHWRRTFVFLRFVIVGACVFHICFMIWGYGGFDTQVAADSLDFWLMVGHILFSYVLATIAEAVFFVMMIVSFPGFYRIWKEQRRYVREKHYGAEK
jgi:hypothetical protein